MGDASKTSVNGHRGGSRRLNNGRFMHEYYEPFPPNHFAPKAGHRELNVAIIGAGIAGLSAAIALLQSGHNVELYERSQFANEIGAAINMCPNAARVLSYYEFDFPGAMPTSVDELTFLDGHTLETLRHSKTPDWEQLYAAPFLLYHRVDLHSELQRMVTQPRPNTQAVAKIHLLSEVVDIDLDGGMTLADGRKLQKDLIIVADGVRTRFASKVVGDGVPVRAVPTGTAVHRFLISTNKLLADPQTRPLFEGKHGELCITPYQDIRLVWYPCRGGVLINFGFFHADQIQGFQDEVWNIPTTREEFMEFARPLHPDLQAVCSKAEDLKLWRLCQREKPIQTLTKGHVVLIGDAAHPMLPHQGQGGGMAIEDAAALGVLFSDFGVNDQVNDRLRLFQELRLERVSAMQIFSSVGQDESAKIAETVRPYVKGPLPGSAAEYHEYNFTPNVLRDALELLDWYLGERGE